MRDFEIGKLKNQYVVYWYDTPGVAQSRRRFRLAAKNKAEAWAEGERRYNAEMALKGEDLRLSDIWQKYVSYLVGRRTAAELISLWKTVGPILGSFHPLSIDDDKISEYTHYRKKQFRLKNGREISSTTLHHEINLIQSVLNFGYRKNLCDKPIKLKKPRAKTRKDVWLNEKQIYQLLNETLQTPHLHIAVALMLGTAARISAILELTWDRVDFVARTIDLRVVASQDDEDEMGDVLGQNEGDGSDEYQKARTFVPMNDGLYTLLRSWKEKCDSDYVVEYRGGPVKSIYISFKKAAKRAGCGDTHPHCLRHTAAVHMAASGSSMARISQYLGHSSVKVTEKIYARFAPDHLRKESNAVDFLHRWTEENGKSNR